MRSLKYIRSIKTTFADRLKDAMRWSGITSTELSKKTGLSLPNISHLTAGQREPSLETLAKLLRAMPGIDAYYLVTGDY